MKLWLLTPVVPWDPWYDKAFGFVVRAETEQEARQMAEEKGGDETSRWGKPGEGAWLNDLHTECVELTADGKSEVVLVDFRAA